jgi:2-keto-4-pentenoate hydratase/2-oxohepta-3-ene-1,7-dioic acid hydratase in catechol pathway
MRIIRFLDKDGSPRFGWVNNDEVGVIVGTPYESFRRSVTQMQLKDLKLLAPVEPSKIVCVGRNYAAHAAELNNDLPEQPLIFLKPPSTIIGPHETILLPPQSQKVEHEGELAVVIGKQSRWVAPEDALKNVLGYTVANDITARDLQRRDKQWTRGKGFDTFCPVGPWIETEFDAADAVITTMVNGELRQMGSTRDMVFRVRQLIAYVTSFMTLEPGDLLLTGTPSGVGPLKDGDVVEVSIEKLGALSNPVKLDDQKL